MGSNPASATKSYFVDGFRVIPSCDFFGGKFIYIYKYFLRKVDDFNEWVVVDDFMVSDAVSYLDKISKFRIQVPTVPRPANEFIAQAWHPDLVVISVREQEKQEA